MARASGHEVLQVLAGALEIQDGEGRVNKACVERKMLAGWSPRNREDSIQRRVFF
jgi:hypothetical protein